MADVDDYIFNLSPRQQLLATRLRKIILHTVPGIQEKLSYKIPFYHYYGMFCYINAIPGGIDLGICRGIDLLPAFPSLEGKGRAIVATVSLFIPNDIVSKEVREIIIASAQWNEEAKKKGIPMINKKKKTR